MSSTSSMVHAQHTGSMLQMSSAVIMAQEEP